MEERTKQAVSWGNSAGVLLPREWAGREVKIILIDRTLEIKKEALSILDKYLEDIQGIYLAGSYARGEQAKDSDIDIIAVSGKTKKEIISGKYHISIAPLESIKKTMKSNPILIYPRLIEAKVLLNSSLLEELKNLKIEKASFKKFLEECRRIVKINREFIELDKLKGEHLESDAVIYSTILRLRGIFLIKSILSKTKYSNEKFLFWLEKETKSKEIEKAYELYKIIRDGKKHKIKILISTAEELVNILEKEVRKLRFLDHQPS